VEIPKKYVIVVSSIDRRHPRDAGKDSEIELGCATADMNESHVPTLQAFFPKRNIDVYHAMTKALSSRRMSSERIVSLYLLLPRNVRHIYMYASQGKSL
jgi:hypothetical protein